MPKFPEPPPVDELRRLAPDVATLAAGSRLWRVYFRGGRHPTAWNAFRTFGPTNSRFDHHLPGSSTPGRAILYASADGPTCLAEVFQDTRTIDRRRNDPWLVGFDLAQPVHLLDLMGTWPTQAGASMAIASGPRPRARRWSQAIYQAYPAVEGLQYGSSMNANMPAVALYERAVSALPLRPVFHRALADLTMTTSINNAARRFGYLVV